MQLLLRSVASVLLVVSVIESRVFVYVEVLLAKRRRLLPRNLAQAVVVVVEAAPVPVPVSLEVLAVLALA